MKLFQYTGIKTGVLALLLITCTQCAGKDKIAPGFFSRGSIGDIVWLDTDADGQQETGEPGFQGIAVILLDENGNEISSTVTDAGGKYLFSDIDAGTTGKTYEVWFKLPADYHFSRRNGSLADGQNSDANEITGKSGTFILLPGQVNDAVDAGVISPALGTLPLHTLDLTAELKSGKVNLKWLAENEMNTARFLVQQSTDGVNFSNIGITAVSGVINIPTYYYYAADINMLTGYSIIYFRIRAEDMSNRAAYSNIIPVRLDKITGIRVWPNPFVTSVRVSYDASVNTMLDMQLTDGAGTETWKGTFEISRGMNQLSLEGLAPQHAGLYYLHITDRTSGQSFTQKLIK